MTLETRPIKKPPIIRNQTCRPFSSINQSFHDFIITTTSIKKIETHSCSILSTSIFPSFMQQQKGHYLASLLRWKLPKSSGMLPPSAVSFLEETLLTQRQSQSAFPYRIMKMKAKLSQASAKTQKRKNANLTRNLDTSSYLQKGTSTLNKLVLKRRRPVAKNAAQENRSSRSFRSIAEYRQTETDG